jgi:hypothetical protein
MAGAIVVANEPPRRLETAFKTGDGLAETILADLLALPNLLLRTGVLKDNGAFIGSEKAVDERTRNA